MMNHEIIRLGNPKLRLISEPVRQDEFGTSKLHDLINLLYELMLKSNGIGIAAPQIGINKRIFVFGFKDITQDSPIPPYTVLINPTLEFLTEELEEDYESCLSVGSLHGKVARYSNLFYKGLNEEGKTIEREVKGLHARVVQHEYDHLEGTIFLDRVKDNTTLFYPEEIFKENEMEEHV